MMNRLEPLVQNSTGRQKGTPKGVDETHRSDHDHEKTKFIEEMNKLESFVTSAEPYSCKEFPGVKELFQAIKSNNEEKDEENKLLLKENKELQEKIEQMKQEAADQACSNCCCIII